MMLLVIDTALASCSVCVYDSTQVKILAEECERMERGHAEALPPMVARVMAASGLIYKNLNRIAVTTGPGTFTGIRIGLSFARALGLSLKLEVVGVNSLVATQVAVIQPKYPVFVAHKVGSSNFTYIQDLNHSINIELSNSVQVPLGKTMVIGTAADEIVAAAGRADLIRSLHHDLPRASGFAAYAATLPKPDTMPEPLYLREADAKPQTAALRALPNLMVSAADPMAIPVLAHLHAKCFAEAWDEAAITAIMASPGSGAFLATSVEGPVGLLIYRIIAGEAEILTFGVDPALRRRGVGQALLTTLKDLNHPIFLEVASQNSEALSLYTRVGFVKAGLRKAYYATSGDDALILQWQA